MTGIGGGQIRAVVFVQHQKPQLIDDVLLNQLANCCANSREANLERYPLPHFRVACGAEECTRHLLPARLKLRPSPLPRSQFQELHNPIGWRNKFAMGDLDDIPVVQDSVSEDRAEC
jgi:hypothetical protein